LTTSTFDLLAEEVEARKDAKMLNDMDEMASVYEGNLPSKYDRYFPGNEERHIVNLIRLAWDDLATSVGRLPDLRADTRNLTDREQKRAGMLERVGFNYLRNAEPSGKILMWMAGWDLVGLGAMSLLVVPDTERRQPVITIRDPRTAHPKASKKVRNQIITLEDIIYDYTIDSKTAGEMGLAAKTNESGRIEDDVRILEYIDGEQWVVCSDGGTVKRTEHGLGFCPATYGNTFSPNQAHLGQFQDQLSLMVAVSRILTQKLAFGDRVVYPLMWVRGHQGTIRIGPHVLNKLGPQGEMGQIAPPVQLQADRDLEILERFSRILNRNPEVRQGEIQTKGTYTSAKTLEQLAEAIDTVIGRMWDIMGVTIQHTLEACYRMDEKLWPDTPKVIVGSRKGRSYTDEYTPTKDIAGHYKVNVDYGFGLGGYQGFLMQLQAKDARLQSRRGAIEEMPGVSDVDEKMREIELESLDDATQAAFLAQAQQGALDVVLIAKLREAMAKKGKPLNDMILEYEDEIRAQATQATQQGGAEALTTPPAPEEGMVPEEEAPLQGVPPLSTLGV